MATNEVFKVVRRGRWSAIIEGRGAVQYSPDRWTQPTCEAFEGDGPRLSVFQSYNDAIAFQVDVPCTIWRCMYRGKPHGDAWSPNGTLRVTSVKLIERVWPKKETNDGNDG